MKLLKGEVVILERWKILFALKTERGWLFFLPKAWKSLRYWVDYRRPRPWVESISVMGLRLEVHAMRVING